ncbi:TetR family transcriptional regulator [Halobacillus litoralis]|uniref:TetR family transcriptional regulator n=1 Tax=Halobacillus litoralis TaxID=45668 RepID=A0A845FEB3_9BACI|nr:MULTISPECIES: TetR/AcrR family transcriptional regulator [Halobacillus]MEC3884976.1 TetR/AcrR family transcriptional regulator [Halobacillus sp. HZG1]MYL72104.1 TetR family transcriptional regulator [Halobacillus litoralis]
MNGFERRKERKKQNILNASLKLFSEYGVQKVSIQEIAKKAQVSQVTIYNYFGGKDELLFETVKKFIYERLDRFRDVVHNDDMDFKDKIRFVIQDKKENILHMDPGFLETVMRDQPELQELIHTFTQKDAVPLLMELVEQGKTQGFVHPDISFRSIMFYIEMYYQAMRSKEDFFDHSLPELSEEITHMFFYGLMGNQDEHLHED